MIVATLRIAVPARRRDETRRALLFILGQTEVQPGCRGCRLYQDTERPNAFALVQEWASQADLDRHIRSHVYGKVLAIMETAAEPPELRFDTIAHTIGIEAVHAVRGDKVDHTSSRGEQ